LFGAAVGVSRVNLDHVRAAADCVQLLNEAVALAPVTIRAAAAMADGPVIRSPLPC